MPRGPHPLGRVSSRNRVRDLGALYCSWMSLIAMLEAGRRDFLEATSAISPEQASAKPAPGRWSVLECFEHVIAVEERYLDWISAATAVAPQRSIDKELRLFTTIRSRLTKVEAPEVVRPKGRFDSLGAALAEFRAIRDRSILVVREQGDALYSLGATHPYFGEVNGVELVHLMDGHARRHADQIRETWEALLAAAPKSPPRRAGSGSRRNQVKAKRPFTFKRDPPDLPARFEPRAEPDRSFADSESVAIEEQRLQDQERTNLRIGSFRLEGSVLERIQFADGQFGSAVWKDVRLVGCDLANIRAPRFSLVRVELIDCRLTGLNAAALDWQEVLIQNGDLRYSQLQGGKFQACEFDGCNWQEADLQTADLTGSIFRSCNLARADLRRAKLRNADFRTSQIEGMLVGMGDLQGAIVDPAQAMVLARLMGLQIA